MYRLSARTLIGLGLACGLGPAAALAPQSAWAADSSNAAATTSITAAPDSAAAHALAWTMKDARRARDGSVPLVRLAAAAAGTETAVLGTPPSTGGDTRPGFGESPALGGEKLSPEPADPGAVDPGAVEPGPASPDAPSPDVAPQSEEPDEGANAPAGRPQDPNKPIPEIHYGADGLPPAVAKTRQALLDAAKTGDIGKLKDVIAANKVAPSFGKEKPADPVAYLKSQSGDPEGREVLAILTDLLETGWVHINVGKPDEMYVWPYFAEVPIEKLTPPQLVELYRILTATDVEEMRAYDEYLFFKVGIAPDGTWKFFKVADDQ
ncbi:hypothetical protein [Segnochrobactrum spirostomi]|uniref:Uncharacterized protein n=1 Tax=Segnochrobactrum spirostomi TaxID=2608987 RepID=A0A6A7Y4G0_9HYPH|nr:hypothetical protein [Segnochrobactrum spirostomi]MQT14030.1 hypothetical protein [Segnochrobactrum spirostomi]